MREELDRASDLLASAAGNAGDEAAERLTDLSEQLASLATRDRGPDHGRLARTENALDDIRETVDEAAAADIDAAHEAVVDYRSGIEGV